MAEIEVPFKDPTAVLEMSTLRRRSFNPNQSAVPVIEENDDVAELSSRRKSVMMDKRKSMGLNKVAQMPESQMEEKMKFCIQLNAENKINIQNAFKFEIIDILTCMVQRNSANSNLQVASSSLDVSSKIYSLRVDNIHTDVLKMLGAMDKQNKDQNEEDEGIDNAADENSQTNREHQKKKRKRKRTSVLSKIESLNGNVDLTTPESLMMQDGDPQTSDMLYQTVLPLATQKPYYMNSLSAIDISDASLDILKDVKFPDLRPKLQNIKNLELCSGFGDFSFNKWSIGEDEKENEEEVPISQLEKSVFHYDLDASLPPDDAQFNNSYTDKENVADSAMYFSKGIASGIKIRTLEYSFVPTHEIIHWAGPSYWKIKINNKNMKQNKIEGTCGNMKQQNKKKVLNLDFNEETIQDATKLLKMSRSTQFTVKTMKSWSEEKIMISDDVTSNYDSTQLFKYHLRPESNIKIMQEDELNTTHLNDNDDEIIYDYNNALDTSEYCPNVNPDEEAVHDDFPDEDEGLGKLIGNNLVEMPDLVGDTFIPYSKRAKKIDVRQLKKSIWRTITKDDENECNTDKSQLDQKLNAKSSFTEIYNNLPSLLTKNNLEALSVPVCFVSLLHLANEKSLFIEPNCNLSDLNIKVD